MNQPQPVPGTPRENLRAIRIFFIVTVIGALLFAGIVILLNLFRRDLLPDGKSLENVLLPLAAVIGIACLAAAMIGYRKSMRTLKNSQSSLNDKLNEYRTALIKYVAVCEVAALFGIISYFLTNNFYLLSVTGIMLTAMLAKAPTRRRVIEELDLDWTQQGELD